MGLQTGADPEYRTEPLQPRVVEASAARSYHGCPSAMPTSPAREPQLFGWKVSRPGRDSTADTGDALAVGAVPHLRNQQAGILVDLAVLAIRHAVRSLVRQGHAQGHKGPRRSLQEAAATRARLADGWVARRHSGCRGPVDAPGRSAGVGRATCPGPATLEVGCWRQLDHEGHLACSSRESRLFTRSRPIGDSTHRSPGTFRIALAGPAGCMSLFDEHCQSPARWMCAAGGQTLLLADSCPGRPMWLRCSKFFNVFG